MPYRASNALLSFRFNGVQRPIGPIKHRSVNPFPANPCSSACDPWWCPCDSFHHTRTCKTSLSLPFSPQEEKALGGQNRKQLTSGHLHTQNLATHKYAPGLESAWRSLTYRVRLRPTHLAHLSPESSKSGFRMGGRWWRGPAGKG